MTSKSTPAPKPCPTCGTCPTCGHRPTVPAIQVVRPIWIYPYTQQPYSGPYWWGGSSTYGTTSTAVRIGGGTTSGTVVN